MLDAFTVPSSVLEARAEMDRLRASMAAIQVLRATAKIAGEAKPGELMLHLTDQQYREWLNDAEIAWRHNEARYLYLNEWVDQSVKIARK